MTYDESITKAEQLLKRLEEVRAKLQATEDSDTALALIEELAGIAKEVQAEIERARREADAAT
jgi:hypothetical protein